MVEQTHTAGWWPNIYQPLRQIGQKVSDWFAPATEAFNDDDAYKISVELPGVKPDDVEVTVQNNLLLVRGEKRSNREEKGQDFYFSEREYGSFQRTFRLPPDADNEKVEANFADGVLEMKISKLVQTDSASKRIQIRETS